MSWFSDNLAGFGKKIYQGLSWVGNKVANLWNDFTGQTAVDKQNAANLELAKYQQQVQEDYYNKYSSPEALMRQYREAGLNPNLVYGSASAGQSNVPSFDAPHVERNLSGSDKINKVLSALSAGLGLAQNVYQADAARESAEQSAIKTLSDRLSLISQRWNLTKENTLLGTPYLWDTFLRRRPDRRGNEEFTSPGMIVLSGDSFLNQYFKTSREKLLNDQAKSLLGNSFDFGLYYDEKGKLHKSTIPSYLESRNYSSRLKYKLMNEIGNTGTYGKLLLSALDLIF